MELKQIYELMDKFDKSSLSEIKIVNGESSVTIKKGSDAPVFQGPAYGYQVAPASPAPAAAPVAVGAPAVAASKPGVEILTSPIVGTFYRSAAPDQPSFSEVGLKVDAGATLCILEAMKVMNKFEAEFKLEIVSILASNGQMVEFGTPLFEVKRI